MSVLLCTSQQISCGVAQFQVSPRVLSVLFRPQNHAMNVDQIPFLVDIQGQAELIPRHGHSKPSLKF